MANDRTMAIVTFFFDDIGHYIGLVVVLGVALGGLAAIIRAMRGRPT